MLEVSDSAVLMLSLLLFFDSEGLLPVFLMAAALHELGHLIALRACGGRLRRLHISALGGRMDCTLPEGRAKRFCIHAAGAAMNLAAFVFFRLLGWPLAAGANFVLLALNLLPVCPLDGYACLEELLDGRFQVPGRCLSAGFAALLLLFGTYIFCSGGGVSLAAIGVFLTFFSGKNLRKR